MSEIEIVQRGPSPDEHARLRAAAGLRSSPGEVIDVGLAGSWFAVTAREDTGHAVGMGRLVGDGALFLQVVDVVVHPDHQGRGLGSRILTRLLEHADHHAPHAYLSLIAGPPRPAALPTVRVHRRRS